jgi:dienelactone hydrolase
MRHIGDLRNDRTALVRRVLPAIEILSSRPEVDGRIAAVGYCFGGMIALEYARSGSTISGVVSVHGGLGRDSGFFQRVI